MTIQFGLMTKTCFHCYMYCLW